MAQWHSTDVPHLVILAPAPDRGRRIELSGDYLIVGREQTCDVRLDDPHVSRTHAALERRGDGVYVQDLGSSGGTFVNGAPATPRQLRSGDIVGFANVKARFEAGAPLADPTSAMPATQGPAPAKAEAVHYSIDQQQAGAINNVGRDQYQAYFHQVVHERDTFYREIAAVRTKARWLVTLGVVIIVVGFAMFVLPGVGFAKQIDQQISSGTAGPVTNPGGPLILGIPMQELGWIVFAIGMLIAGTGSVLHRNAVARRGRFDRDHPLPPPPWQPSGPGSA
jgi:FHA domain